MSVLADPLLCSPYPLAKHPHRNLYTSTHTCAATCTGAFAAYGIISNLNAGVLVTLSWLSVVKQTGLTPLDPGMWPRFLGIYAGLYLAVGSLMRPLRLAAALAAAPFFNKVGWPGCGGREGLIGWAASQSDQL